MKLCGRQEVAVVNNGSPVGSGASDLAMTSTLVSIVTDRGIEQTVHFSRAQEADGSRLSGQSVRMLLSSTAAMLLSPGRVTRFRNTDFSASKGTQSKPYLAGC
jgi:hypothetical protein